MVTILLSTEYCYQFILLFKGIELITIESIQYKFNNYYFITVYCFKMQVQQIMFSFFIRILNLKKYFPKYHISKSLSLKYYFQFIINTTYSCFMN